MSELIFPEFKGRTWGTVRTQVWSTEVQTASSGREVRVGRWSTPRWRWRFSLELLRSSLSRLEFQKFTGFCGASQGAFSSFLYRDPEDCRMSGQAVATGNGTTKSFQVVRTAGVAGYGTLTEPVRAVKASDPAPVIYIAGVELESGWSIDSAGLLTFTTAPDMGAEITADFDFYWRCRFVEDELGLENFLHERWKTADAVEIISLK